MLLFFRSYSGPLHRTQQQLHIFQIHLRTYVDGTMNWVWDRDLDHAVEREKNLLPVMNIKDFIKSQSSKSVPLSIITQKGKILRIPTPPIILLFDQKISFHFLKNFFLERLEFNLKSSWPLGVVWCTVRNWAYRMG